MRWRVEQGPHLLQPIPATPGGLMRPIELNAVENTVVTDRQYGATDVRRNGAISKCLKWGLERC
jgi:hypothetical protein